MKDAQIRHTVFEAVLAATQEMYDLLMDRSSVLYTEDGKATCAAENVAHGIDKLVRVSDEIVKMAQSYRVLCRERQSARGEYARFLTEQMESYRESAFHALSESDIVTACSSTPPVGMIDKIMPK